MIERFVRRDLAASLLLPSQPPQPNRAQLSPARRVGGAAGMGRGVGRWRSFLAARRAAQEGAGGAQGVVRLLDAGAAYGNA